MGAEPHGYGFLNHAAKLLAYQIRSERSPVPGWRLFEVLKMERRAYAPLRVGDAHRPGRVEAAISASFSSRVSRFNACSRLRASDLDSKRSE